MGPLKFTSAKYSLWKLDALESDCENYGQGVIYKGMIENCTLDAEFCVGLELAALAGIEFIDGIHQSNCAGAVKIIKVNVIRKSDRQTIDDVTDQRLVLDDNLFFKRGRDSSVF